MGTTVYDLSACCCEGFCNCPAPIPETLTATFTNVSCDPGFTGATATLTRNEGGQFRFAGVINGRNFNFGINCGNNPPMTHPVTLDSPTGAECILVHAAFVDATCDPFDVTFNNADLISSTGSCGCSTGKVNVHITE